MLCDTLSLFRLNFLLSLNKNTTYLTLAKTFYWGYLDSTFNCLAQKKKKEKNMFCYVSGFLGELWSNLCIMDWIIIKMILQIHKVLNRNKFTSQKVVLGRKNIFNPQLACLLLNPYFTQSSSWKEKMLNPQLACFLLNPFFLPMLKLCVCDVSMGDSGKHFFWSGTEAELSLF